MARDIHVPANKHTKDKTYRQISANRAFLSPKECIKSPFHLTTLPI